MTPGTNVSWWPADLLSRHPVKQVIVCGRQVEPPLSGHVVNFPRLEVPLRGSYENQIELEHQPRTVQLKPGMALFAPANCWNLPTWRNRVQVLSLLFGRKQFGMSLVTSKGATLSAEKFSMPRPLTGPLPKILDAMVEVHGEGGPAAVLPDLARALLGCVQEFLLRPGRGEVNSAKSLLENVCVFLQNQYQYDVSRDFVARQFGISPNYLSRVFQVHGHMTFSSYLMHVRTDRAKHLLRSYDFKLDDVAARCGYRDTAYFCRVFKKLAKATPAEYRRQQNAETQALPRGGVVS